MKEPIQDPVYPRPPRGGQGYELVPTTEGVGYWLVPRSPPLLTEGVGFEPTVRL